MKVSLCLLLAAVLSSSCSADNESVLEIGTEPSLSIVAERVNNAASKRFSSGYRPNLEQRFRLGRGVVVDLIHVQSDVIDVQETYWVAAGRQFEPFILSSASDAAAVLQSWWPESGAETLEYCALAARAQWQWARAAPVIKFATVDADVLVADRERLLSLSSPVWQDLTATRASVEFWLVHSGGSTKVQCQLLRHSGDSPTLLIEKVDSLPGLGFYRLGG